MFCQSILNKTEFLSFGFSIGNLLTFSHVAHMLESLPIHILNVKIILLSNSFWGIKQARTAFGLDQINSGLGK